MMSDQQIDEQAETVEYKRMFPLRRIFGVVGPFLFGAMLLVFAGAVASGKPVKREDLVTIPAILLALLVAGVYGLRKGTSYDYYWRTDSRGLTVRGAGRRELLPWSEVVYAKTQ